MAEAFKTVSREKNFSEITISELLEVSGLEREVFEQYFDDLHDLLRWILEQESVAVIRQYQLLSRLEDIIYYTIDYVEKIPISPVVFRIHGEEKRLKNFSRPIFTGRWKTPYIPAMRRERFLRSTKSFLLISIRKHWQVLW